jgi:MinD superfamily P-loop ATPase
MLTGQKTVQQLVILSGKGGTGKTILSASLMHFASQTKNKGVLVDADVDAANLALVLQATPITKHAFWGSQTAEIDYIKCNRCDRCYQVCRFDAIHQPTDQKDVYKTLHLLCEGCAACMYICPESAIQMIKQQDGEWYHSLTLFGDVFHAELFPGAENSGKLVTTVKQNAKLFAEDNHLPLMIVDGPPGIGCPVISASAGADLALLVAEPGVSGFHDLERIIQTLNHFNIPVLICINKADLYPEGTRAITQFAESNGYGIAGKIPFDDTVPHSIVNAQPVSVFAPENQVSLAIGRIWSRIQKTLFAKDES